ncbi:hypothetical protein J7E71_05780 [Mesobacillus foraminis]|nr:hypothetical protein [Mesobacillus foraminis]
MTWRLLGPVDSVSYDFNKKIQQTNTKNLYKGS